MIQKKWFAFDDLVLYRITYNNGEKDYDRKGTNILCTQNKVKEIIGKIDSCWRRFCLYMNNNSISDLCLRLRGFLSCTEMKM